MEGLSFLLLAILLWLDRLPLSLLFFSPPRFPGTLDVTLWDHEGPTARTLTLSRELGCIPCPESSDSKTTETDAALADLGQDVACWCSLGCRGVHFLEAGEERVLTDPPT